MLTKTESQRKNIMNKIGFSTSCTFPYSLDKSFKIGKEAGYDGIEIMITNDKLTRDASYLRSLEDKYDLPILSFHAPTLLLTHFVWGTDPQVKLHRTAELAAEVGADTVVVHPPFAWQGAYSEDFLEIVEDITKDTDVAIAVENMFPWRFKDRVMKAYKPSWETIVDTTPYITLDFSHAALSGWNSFEVAQTLGNKLRHIHLCDGIGTSNPNGKDKVFDEHLLPGQGNQPIKETLKYLQTNDWDGHIVAEINTRKARSRNERLNMLKDTLKWTRNVLAN
jgi:sugar phosphate isomerase/epimerase